jgi:hypothetical protein
MSTRRPSRTTCTSWWRYSKKLAIDDWSDVSAWRARVPTNERWLSTNHLMGRGYWVWFIPPGSGSASVGIVADAKLHPFLRISKLEPAPRLAARIRAAGRRRLRGAPPSASGFPRAEALRVRLPPGVFTRSMGVHR